jgi:hypothetical protein
MNTIILPKDLEEKIYKATNFFLEHTNKSN